MFHSRPTTSVRNPCAGPFGAVYDYYIERPRLARLVLGLAWGVDARPFYRSLEAVGELRDGATILDVPCGGGVALQGLRSGQRASWIGVDVDPAMLRRMRRRAASHRHVDLRLVQADMGALPLEDGTADICLTYGGIHCVSDPAGALVEITRCLRPGGRLLGSTFVAEGTRRQRRMLQTDSFGTIGTAEELMQWLRDSGLAEVSLDRTEGLVVFSARHR